MKKQKIIITFIILIFLLPMQSKALNDTNTLINTENEEKTESTTKITQEDIEKHDELNPVLFSDNKLKPEVKDKAIEVATELLAIMEENGLSIKLKDLILTGSNASYNYTKDSDIDLHLVADMTNITDQKELYTILFNSQN